MMRDQIPLFRPVIAEDAIDAAAAVLRSGWPGPGPVVEQFEEAFARRVGAAHAVAVTSGTAALHLALRLLDLASGDEVITSPITFVGANEVILHERCRPVFADVDPLTGNLDPASVLAAVGVRTRAIVTTHLGGRPSDLTELRAVAERAGVALIEDAAHACGSTYQGRPIGGHGNTVAFSFQATKNLPTVDGGMVCLPSATDAARARRLRWMGIDRTTWSRNGTTGYDWAYGVAEVGHKYAMNDLNAALGLAQLAHVDAGNARRVAIADRYQCDLSKTPGIVAVPIPSDRTSARYLFPVVVEDRDLVHEAMKQRGIGTGAHYRRNDHHPVFGGEFDLPGAEQYWTHTLSLPMHLALSDCDVDVVMATLGEVVPPRPAAR